MRTLLLVGMALVAGCTGMRTRTTLVDPLVPLQSSVSHVCLLAGSPPIDIRFMDIGQIKVSKRSYGGSDQVEAAMADEARRIGADAIAGVQTANRFKGPLPWRVMAPTGAGTAIKITSDSPPLDCVGAGGHLL